MTSRIRDLLQRVADQDTGRPSKVVTLPPKLDELHNEIRRCINRRVDAEAERARMEMEFEKVEQEFSERIAAIDQRLADLKGDLIAKQKAMIAALSDSGIKAEIVGGGDGR